MGLKVIITGATGMVGEGVLLECLENPAVEKVLMPNHILTLHEVGLAMLNSVTEGCDKQVLEIKDIKELAKM